MEETKTLLEEFAEKAKAFLRESYPSEMDVLSNGFLSIDEMYDDLLHEIGWQIADWYDGESYYAKPEEILVDYVKLSPLDAHRFLPLFIESYVITPQQEEYMKHDADVIKEVLQENCDGKDSCEL